MSEQNVGKIVQEPGVDRGAPAHAHDPQERRGDRPPVLGVDEVQPLLAQPSCRLEAEYLGDRLAAPPVPGEPVAA